ncbi:MAG: DUF721 domain-containing protein [Bacteroidetes bacterium]|uniref:DUF721 domain-containing protein n=1 Tax=Candidatus Enterocola intestinipullorum TaxID=2840783 RepID=A0A9D9EEJ2_9BACT|nr:DUF721 domain-containing protein [Candidatus Enterocola intestinipullorum]
MRRSQPLSIGEAIDAFFKSNGMSRKLEEISLMKRYDEAVGEAVASYTRRKFLRGGILYMDLVSGAARNEVNINKAYFIRRFNELAGEKIVDDIILI